MAGKTSKFRILASTLLSTEDGGKIKSPQKNPTISWRETDLEKQSKILACAGAFGFIHYVVAMFCDVNKCPLMRIAHQPATDLWCHAFLSVSLLIFSLFGKVFHSIDNGDVNEEEEADKKRIHTACEYRMKTECWNAPSISFRRTYFFLLSNDYVIWMCVSATQVYLRLARRNVFKCSE